MAITDALLAEYDHEMATTRRLLDRIPEAEFGWKPHEKSFSMGELSGHLAYLPAWCSAVLDLPSFDVATMGDEARVRAPASRQVMLDDFDRRVAAARDSLARRTDDEMLAMWTLKQGTQEIFTMPRVSAIRSFVMNHAIHHRGQLSVYLRLKNIPVPPVYGPTADEQ